MVGTWVPEWPHGVQPPQIAHFRTVMWAQEIDVYACSHSWGMRGSLLQQLCTHSTNTSTNPKGHLSQDPEEKIPDECDVEPGKAYSSTGLSPSHLPCAIEARALGKNNVTPGDTPIKCPWIINGLTHLSITSQPGLGDLREWYTGLTRSGGQEGKDRSPRLHYSMMKVEKCEP